MARNLKDAHIPKTFGPSGSRILQCCFIVTGATITVPEEQGCTVTRTGVGTYEIALGQIYKNINVSVTTIAASTAQLFLVTAADPASKVVTIKQVTAGGGTAVDTLTARIDVQIMARRSS